MSKKNESFFWTSYSDLMTSLFFVMLVLFVLTIALLHKRMVEIDNERKATQEQLDKIELMQKATENINSEYFVYDQKFKRHTLNVVISFKTQSADILDIDYKTREKLKDAGNSIKKFMTYAYKNDTLKEAKYLLIIEGQSSRDSYKKNFELSYERALHLVQFWEKHNISFDNMENCELLISGSGTKSRFREPEKIRNDSLNKYIVNPKNQRFVVHIIPKPVDFRKNK